MINNIREKVEEGMGKGIEKDRKNDIKKVALLSNVNMNFVIRLLQKELAVYEAEGYGNELGILMNPASSYHAFGPELTFLVMDLKEALEGELDPEKAGSRIESWFGQLEAAMVAQAGSNAGAGCIYYISDAYLWGVEVPVAADAGRKQALEQIWQEHLEKLCGAHANVRIFPYRRIIEGLGEDNAFSLKMWYMGRILLSNEGQKRLCDAILHRVRLESYVPKKVLLLDLDNTLWGGLAGEADHTPVALSEEHSGLAYKNLQRVLLQMQQQGVLLGIVSKNNEEDAGEILEKHPHMVLRPEHFAVQKINWRPKHENIKEIARELNVGLDSIVFFDDSPAERRLVRELLPQVTVPELPGGGNAPSGQGSPWKPGEGNAPSGADLPSGQGSPWKPEELAPAMVEIYHKYFEKPFVTAEDRRKTKQYTDNARRDELQGSAGSFEEYLRQLHIVMRRVDAAANIERLTQLANKTNQFNLTTRRYTQGEMQQVLADGNKRVYLYQVADRFGDSGQVAVVIVDLAGEAPVIEEFAMSCRVMGRKIEDAIVDDVERGLLQAGYARLRGRYLPTQKNQPVGELYPQLGYEKIMELPGGGAEFEIEIAKAPKRVYYVDMENCME